MNEELTMINMEIIAKVGEAKSLFIEAIDLAMENNQDEALKKLKEGRKSFNEGHKAHAKLLSMMANGEQIIPDIFTIHAQCQMMSAEDFSIIAQKVLNFANKNQ